MSNKISLMLGGLSEQQRVSLKVTLLLFVAMCGFLFVLLPLAASDNQLIEVIARIVTVIVFVAFFTSSVIGGLKGAKEEIVVFYDKKDAVTAFMIICWIFIGSILWWLTIGFPESYESGFFASFQNYGYGLFVLSGCAYFTFKTISNFLYHNNDVDSWNLFCGASVKLVAGVIYPLIILNNISKVSNYGKSEGGSTAGQVIVATCMTFISTKIVGRLVNGEAVYLKRGCTEEARVDGVLMEAE